MAVKTLCDFSHVFNIVIWPLLTDIIILDSCCLEWAIDVIISNIRLHNIRLQLGPYYEYREGQMTHHIACNMITVESMEDKHPWKKNYVIKCMSQTLWVVVFYVCCESQFRICTVETSSIKRQPHLHIYDTKKPKNIVSHINWSWASPAINRNTQITCGN